MAKIFHSRQREMQDKIYQAGIPTPRERRLNAPAIFGAMKRMVATPKFLAGLGDPAPFDHFRLQANTKEAFDIARTTFKKSCGCIELAELLEDGIRIIVFQSRRQGFFFELAEPNAKERPSRGDPELVISHLSFTVPSEIARLQHDPIFVRHGGTQCLVIFEDSSLKNKFQTTNQDAQEPSSGSDATTIAELSKVMRRNLGLPPETEERPRNLPSLRDIAPIDFNPFSSFSHRSHIRRSPDAIIVFGHTALSSH